MATVTHTIDSRVLKEFLAGYGARISSPVHQTDIEGLSLVREYMREEKKHEGMGGAISEFSKYLAGQLPSEITPEGLILVIQQSMCNYLPERVFDELENQYVAPFPDLARIAVSEESSLHASTAARYLDDMKLMVKDLVESGLGSEPGFYEEFRGEYDVRVLGFAYDPFTQKKQG